jgi:hypothetical protein
MVRSISNKQANRALLNIGILKMPLVAYNFLNEVD